MSERGVHAQSASHLDTHRRGSGARERVVFAHEERLFRCFAALLVCMLVSQPGHHFALTRNSSRQTDIQVSDTHPPNVYRRQRVTKRYTQIHTVCILERSEQMIMQPSLSLERAETLSKP